MSISSQFSCGCLDLFGENVTVLWYLMERGEQNLEQAKYIVCRHI